jgi:hypothetical protein
VLRGFCAPVSVAGILHTSQCCGDSAHQSVLRGFCTPVSVAGILHTNQCCGDSAHQSVFPGICTPISDPRKLHVSQCSVESPHQSGDLDTSQCFVESPHTRQLVLMRLVGLLPANMKLCRSAGRCVVAVYTYPPEGAQRAQPNLPEMISASPHFILQGLYWGEKRISWRFPSAF